MTGITSRLQENEKNTLLKNLTERLEEMNFDMAEWEIDLSDPLGEGHFYKIEDNFYEEMSDIYVVHRKNKQDKFHLWIDYAYVKGMNEPVGFIESLRAETPELFNKYNIKKLENPDTILKKNLSKEQVKELYSQGYFKEGKHLTLWNSH